MHYRAVAAAVSALSLACANGGTVASDTDRTNVTPPPRAAAVEAPKGPVMDTFAMPTNPQSTASGLQYTIDRVGTGAQPQAGQTVTVHYTGWLTDGTKFDSSRTRNAPFQFPLGRGRVIAGWDEAVAAMKIGEVRTVVIPPAMGYGARGMGGVIPPNATLVFRIELLDAK